MVSNGGRGWAMGGRWGSEALAQAGGRGFAADIGAVGGDGVVAVARVEGQGAGVDAAGLEPRMGLPAGPRLVLEEREDPGAHAGGAGAGIHALDLDDAGAG